MECTSTNVTLVWFDAFVNGLMVLLESHIVTKRTIANAAFVFIPTLWIVYLYCTQNDNNIDYRITTLIASRYSTYVSVLLIKLLVYKHFGTADALENLNLRIS